LHSAILSEHPDPSALETSLLHWNLGGVSMMISERPMAIHVDVPVDSQTEKIKETAHHAQPKPAASYSFAGWIVSQVDHVFRIRIQIAAR
jgi:hypothetical protein